MYTHPARGTAQMAQPANSQSPTTHAEIRDAGTTGELDRIAPDLRDYARELIAAGFTVYAPGMHPERMAQRHPLTFFHYSREVDGQVCYGTIELPAYPALDQKPEHTMPIHPSRLNGSSARIGARWGDPATLNLDDLDPLSVAYAEAVARPENWCPWNAEPTAEAVRRANSNAPMPKRFYGGATLQNAEPWGIGTQYLPVSGTTATTTPEEVAE